MGIKTKKVPKQICLHSNVPSMNKDWFDLDEFQNFYEDLTSVIEKEFSLSDRTTDKNKDGEGSSIQNIKNVNHDMLQTSPSHDLFKSNDALPALVSYTPESNKSSPFPAIEESKIEGDGVKKKKTIKFKFKSGEQRKSPRLIEAKKNPNDYAKHDTKVAAEEGERNSIEDINFELVVIAVVNNNEDEENLDSNNEDKADEDDFIEDDVLEFEDEFENASQYNWCKLVNESLRSTHEEWWDDPHKKYYTGSLVFLLFFYLDRSVHTEYRAERTRLVFIGYRDSLIENRNRSESIDGTFMKGEIDVHQDNEEAAILKLC
ncbi:hypothetical protein DCAR_0727809 [Daucus carota subsp. sativus]|uniref:Uncharacterized protein n=1 Tax=Daucus carota subsp. sativus TaxID=79200 RepID=A0A161Y453_DAUCS|nr:hypothetical protein DCAR_0727809 [Daucus carota subsp. sativus]